ncbi:hypothetical protein EVAR_22620_1 [Eumeta japonica]|uniref:Uncharacterized protein n=1 Tax=Eumeta variegata TaxID=151549 RepID=A0A4C1VJQ1_EUMVA|nr:hypothetical protein EVAR_22620_1 [Eumeta japonica]
MNSGVTPEWVAPGAGRPRRRPLATPLVPYHHIFGSPHEPQLRRRDGAQGQELRAVTAAGRAVLAALVTRGRAGNPQRTRSP